MTKEEKIKEAYGEYWEAIKDNLTESFFVPYRLMENSEGISFEFKTLHITYGKPEPYVRPVSLKGIENNNGWTKIETKEDLPEHSTYIETILNCYDINDPRAQGMHHFILGDEKFLLEKISHYRVIPFNPPIF